MAPYATVSPAIARYLWAARYALDSKMRPKDASLAASVAWYLWDRGHRAAAVRYARELLGRPRSLLPGEQDSGPVILDAEGYVRDVQVNDAVRACLAGLVAMAAAADGDRDQMTKAIAQVDLEALQGLPSLSLAERAEYHARVAIGLNRAGESATAMEMLRLAAESSVTMARRGELTSFQRLCQAVVELLPPDEAVLVWAQWLQAAAQSDAHDVLGMVASYVRWLPAADLAGIVVNPETGDLEPGPR